MELKGDLKRNGLPSLFRNFASENFHGVLTIMSPVGEKLITLTESEVTIYCDELTESSKLGNILLGAGRVTEEVLEGALRDQRRLDPRPKLGDLLIQRGIVTEKIISDARRFQIEEDVCDILSWKNARFSFEGADSAREIHPDDFAYDQVHRMPIDPDSFFKYVTKVTEDWDSISDRLPTQYLCFKLSAKANDGLELLSSESQRVIRFLKEGRSIEGTVKNSCLGRIKVCMCVIDLLEKGLILPASGSDLRFMASEHRAHKRYHDALYIYRRLLESPDAKDERAYLENLIAEISSTIARMKQTGEYGEEAEIVSHKDAKEKYIKTVRMRKIFWGTFGAAALLFAGYVLIQNNRVSDDLPARYRETITRYDQAVAAGEFNAAAKELDDFLETLANKDSHTANIIRDKKTRLEQLLHNYLENQLINLNRLAESGGDSRARAVAEAERNVENYPADPTKVKFQELIDKYKPFVATIPGKPDGSPIVPLNPNDEMAEGIHKIDALIKTKNYMEALRESAAITKKVAAESELWKQAEERTKFIKDAEQKVGEQVSVAEKTWAEKKGDQALELIQNAIPQFGDLPGMEYAETLRARWNSQRTSAQLSFKTAKGLEDKSSFFEARSKYEQIALNYTEFPIAAEARQRAIALKVKCDDLINKINSALDNAKKGDFKRAREIYKPLLELNPSLLLEQRIEIPVFVNSVPPGSTVKLNDQLKGVTPINVLIQVGEPFSITVERPGFASKTVSGDRLTPRDLEIPVRLGLDPVVIDLQAAGAQPFPLLAPAIQFDNRVLILNGPDLIAFDPPSRDPVWTFPGLYDPLAPLPDTVPPEEKNFWNCRLAPVSYKPGFLLLPMRNRQLLEIDLRTPATPHRRDLFSRISNPPPEVAGAMYIEEHSKLAGEPMLVAAFADGTVRCYVDFEKVRKNGEASWILPVDPDSSRRDGPAAGLFGYRNLIWSLSTNGLLQAIDPIEKRSAFKQQFSSMSSRSTFSGTPGDPLAALIQRNGLVILYDLERRSEVWSLPPRRAMEESVGVAIDESGVFVTARKDDYGELLKYSRSPDPAGASIKPMLSVNLDGYVNIDMARGKHLYLITHFNKIFAYSKSDLSLIWEYKMKPDMGAPLSIRAFGEYVYVLTDKGKIIVLKSE